MCISLEESSMFDTKIMIGLYSNEKHFMCYKNNAENYSKYKNIMILPFPTDYLGSDSMIDTSSYVDFLDDAQEACAVDELTISCAPAGAAAAASYTEVFKSGSYDVIVGNSLSSMYKIYKDMPGEKNPQLNLSLLRFLKSHYKGYSFAFCIWDGEINAEPILFTYKPFDYNKIFIPTLDCHNGGYPKSEYVYADHFIMVGSKYNGFLKDGQKFETNKSQLSNQMIDILPNFVEGMPITGEVENGDMFFDIHKAGTIHDRLIRVVL